MKITKKQALELWEKVKLPEEVRQHTKTVEAAALDLAERLKGKGVGVDLNLVEVGALLHDIGRAKDNSVGHGLTGYEILKENEFPEEVCRIARNHVGSGIDKDEAAKLGLPAEDFIPETLEEKIVSYADNLVAGDRIRTFEETLKSFEQKFGPDSKQVERLKKEHSEIEGCESC